MSLLKHADRIALLSLLSVFLGVPAALACSTAGALTDANFRNINAGMSAAEVIARIGPPSSKMRFERSKTTSWSYRFTDAWNYDSEFSVTLDDRGIVVSKFTERIGQ